MILDLPEVIEYEFQLVEEVVEGLVTISGRIRALATAVYLQTDIANHLAEHDGIELTVKTPTSPASMVA